jgi:hypothetical protein
VGFLPSDGFLREKIPEKQLVESTCLFCHRIVAATENLELLAFIEKVHCCPEKRVSPSYTDGSRLWPRR